MASQESISEAFLRSAQITEDLSNLIPLGVLYFTNTPKQPAPSIESPDGWKWFNPPYLQTHQPLYSNHLPKKQSFTQVLIDLSYLIERSHIRVTFKEFHKITILRVYFVPHDVDGNRYLELLRSVYRSGKALSWHVSRFRDIMKRLITILDFSVDNWDSEVFKQGLVLNALKEYEELDLKKLGKMIYYNSESDDDLNYHIDRLTNNEPFSYQKHKTNSKSLEVRLTDIYNSIAFDDSYKKYKQVSAIQGLKSTLYNYQIESIAAMAFKETNTSKILMPNLIPILRSSRTYYFDLVDFTFQEFPEFYESCKGGILAENMGLGKTLICLSLIILTKFEISEIPENFVITDVKDYKVLSLMDQCVRVINRYSIPWKKMATQIPDSCVERLESQPGFFYYKRNESQKLDTSRVNSRNKPIILEEKLLLSSTTLVIVPDNLFNQWNNEIKKHVLESVLKILRLEKNEKLPKASELIKYDLILMTQSVFISEQTKKTELDKVYWKRFIIDEGHSMNQRSSRLVDLSKQLKIERKWVVSGTPTSGLTKLHMNENNESKNHLIKRKFDARNDLTKLGYFVSNFFNIKPWSTTPDLWNKFITKPLLNEHCSIGESLSKLTNLLMVRHALEGTETDVKLPSLYHKPTYLTPSYYNKISINLFTTVLALNAVSSEREGKDYMFDSTNKQELRRLVTNLQRSTFHWTGFSTDDLKSLMAFAKVCLEKKEEKDDTKFYYSIEDRALLKKCVRYCKLALSDRVWRISSSIHEMPYFVDESLDNVYSDNYGLGKANSFINVFGAPQLYSLQAFFYKNRFANDPNILNERATKSSDQFWSHYWKDLTNKKTEKIKNDGRSIEISDINRELDKKHHQTSPKKPKEPPSKIESSKSKILGTASAKLSYMCSRLLEHQFDNVKSIVFFEFEDSAYYLTECLDILGINYVLYSTSVPQGERFQKINNFSNYEHGICLIMDLKLASFGLTITAATRVYFLNPVWNRAVEAQAIKRAHRIGQTNEVHVETLILKDTLEEEMFNRRFIEKENDVDELKIPVADDAQIRDYITQFKFLKTTSKEKVYDSFKSTIIGENIEESINEKDFDDAELLEPVGKKIKTDIVWDIPLFSKDSQLKVIELELKRKLKGSPTKNIRAVKHKAIESRPINDDELSDGETTEEEELQLAINETYNTEELSRSSKRVRFNAVNNESNDEKDHVVKRLRFE